MKNKQMTIYISIKILCIDKELLELATKDNTSVITLKKHVYLIVPDKTKKEVFLNSLFKFKFRNSEFTNSMLLPIEVGYLDTKEIRRVFSNFEFIDEPRVSTHYIVSDIQRSFDSPNTGIEQFEV